MPTTPEQQEIIRRFNYHRPKPELLPNFQALRVAAIKFAEAVYDNTESDREQSLAITKIEEALSWAIGSIARSPANWDGD